MVNRFSTASRRPFLSLTASASGGTLTGGTTYYVGLWAVDAAGNYTQMSVQRVTTPSGGNLCSIAVTIDFDRATDSGKLVISTNPSQGWAGASNAAISISTGATSYSITSYSGSLKAAVPDERFDHIVVQARQGIKLGIFGMTIASVAIVSSPIVDLSFVGTPACNFTVNELAGRTLKILFTAFTELDLPWVEVPIISNTATTIRVNAGAIIGLQPFATGNLVAVEMRCTSVSVSGGNTTLTDTLITNNASGGQATSGNTPFGDIFTGKLLMIVRGKGALQAPLPIDSYAQNSFTAKGTWAITPDTTSEFVVINSAVDREFIGESVALYPAQTSLALRQACMFDDIWRHYFIQVRAADKFGGMAPIEGSLYREWFHPGTGSAGDLLVKVKR